MTALPAPTPRFTWDDYLRWPDDERRELIDGEAWSVAPAPTIRHQAVTLRLASRLEQALRGQPCRPFVAPTDVRLSEHDVVQPDVLVVCDPDKITATHIHGAPDLVAEVLSPATSARDQREKKALYQRAGVREYLILDPLEHYALLHRLGEDGRFGEAVVLATLGGLEIPLWELFELPAPGSEPPARGPAG